MANTTTNIVHIEESKGWRIWFHLHFAITYSSGLPWLAAPIKVFSAFAILFIFGNGLDIKKYPVFGNTWKLEERILKITWAPIIKLHLFRQFYRFFDADFKCRFTVCPSSFYGNPGSNCLISFKHYSFCFRISEWHSQEVLFYFNALIQ